MLHTLLMIVNIVSATCIVALVLVQRGKGADAGAGFGAGASGTVFGARGATTALSRATAVLATIFMVTSLMLAYTGAQRAAPQSELERLATEGVQPEVPVIPGAALPTPPPAEATQPDVPAAPPADPPPAN